MTSERTLQRTNQDKTESVNWWTPACLIVVLAVFAYQSGGFTRFGMLLWDFLTGNLAGTRAGTNQFGELFPQGAAAILADIAASLVLVGLAIAVYGKPKSLRRIWSGPRWERVPGPEFLGITIIVLLEELGARWFALGVLPKLPFLHSDIAFYALVLVGNGLWALIHFSNYKDPAERHVMFVLPQFVGGLALTVIYINFGLLGALLVHLGFNAVMFAVDRISKFGAANGFIIFWNLILVVLASAVLDRPLSDLLTWLHSDHLSALPGWSFWDYFWAAILIGAVLDVVGEVMLFDRESDDLGLEHGIVITAVSLIALVGVIYGLFAFLGLFSHSLAPRLVVMAILLLMLAGRSASGSGVSRIFWIGIPALFAEVCFMQVVGFWPACLLVALLALQSIPDKILRRIAND